MPKHELIFKPGEAIPDGFLSLCKKYFTDKDLVKLEKFGGRIQISVTAPFVDRKSQNADRVITDRLVQSIRDNRNFAKRTFGTMTREQLREVANRLNYPVATKASIGEIRKGLLDFLASSDRWLGISGSA